MTNSFLYLLVTALLTLPAQQEAAPPTPSVADAAKAARGRQSPSKPKRVLTDDDVAHSSNADAALAGIGESQARAQLQIDATVPKVPTAADLTHRIYDLSVASGNSPGIEAENYIHGAVYAYKNPDFPGRKEWEEQMVDATKHFVEEAGTAAARLRGILDENKEAYSRHDPVVAQRVRAQWIEALVPFTTWQMRVHQLMLDGEARAKASAAKAQTR
jgi:hypothetical protein